MLLLVLATTTAVQALVHGHVHGELWELWEE
jgi:hydrogenase/urease accessory protein HupE